MADSESRPETPDDPGSPQFAHKDAAENVEVQDVTPAGKFKALLGIVMKFIGVKDILNLRLSLPSNLLDPVSNLEYWNYMDAPQIFLIIPDPDDPLDRMLNVVRWWYSKDLKWYDGALKKPFNSLLGEQFICKWEARPYHLIEHPSGSVSVLQAYDVHESGELPQDKPMNVYCLTEQISHHPPVSCFYYYSKEKQIIARGIDHIAAKFNGTSVKVSPGSYNHGIYVTLQSRNEEYKLTHPHAYINGLIRASPYLTVGDLTHITCTNGFKAELEYKEESFFGKPKYAVQGKITNAEGKLVCTLSGSWKGKIHYAKVDSGGSTASLASNKTFQTAATSIPAPLLIDMSLLQIKEKIVKPIEELSPFESRRVWGPVIEQMLKNNFGEATKLKRQLEEEQRQREKQFKQMGTAYRSVWFGLLDTTSIQGSLCSADDVLVDGKDEPGKPFIRKDMVDKLPWNNEKADIPDIDAQLQQLKLSQQQ